MSAKFPGGGGGGRGEQFHSQPSVYDSLNTLDLYVMGARMNLLVKMVHLSIHTYILVSIFCGYSNEPSL